MMSNEEALTTVEHAIDYLDIQDNARVSDDITDAMQLLYRAHKAVGPYGEEQMSDEYLQECRLDQLDEDDRGERTRAGQALQGVCRDCGNGTLNNDLNQAFEVVELDYADGEAQLQCANCHSTHLDIL